MRQLRFAKVIVQMRGRRRQRLIRQRSQPGGPRRTRLRRMLRQPLRHAGAQAPPPVLGRIELPRQLVDDPILFRPALRLPLQQAFAGQAAAELHHQLRVLQQALRLRMREP